MSALSIQPTYPIFTDIDGQPLEDGYVWIGAANLDPQTNPINVYWDAALTLPAAQPIRTLAGYPANSGTPARLYVNSDYSIRVMNKNGSAVYSAPAATERYNNVVVNTNAVNVFYDPAGFGAAQTNVQAKLRESVSIKDFGDGVSASALSAAVLHVALSGGGRVIVPAGNYTWTTTTIIPSNVEIDLCGSVITGPGIGSVTDLFQSGYLSGGALVTNIGTPDESNLVLGAQVKNGRIENCGTAFRLFNFLWNSEVSNIQFQDCATCVDADRSFYGRFINLTSRGNAGGSLAPAFKFSDFVNIMTIEGVRASDRSSVGIFLFGAANGQKLLNCAAENCAIGIETEGQTGPLEFDTCYIESCSVSGLNIKNAGVASSISISNGWFNNCAVGISVNSLGCRLYVDVVTEFLACPTKIFHNSAANALGKISIPQNAIADSGYPALPTGYTLENKVGIDFQEILFDSSTGDAFALANAYGGYLVPFEYDGNPGTPKGNTVLFCQHSKSAGTSFSVYIDTKIAYKTLSSLLVYRIEINDNIGSFQLYGLIFGDQANPLDSTGKTVTVSNNGGFMRIEIGTFSSPTEIYTCTGVLRHI